MPGLWLLSISIPAIPLPSGILGQDLIGAALASSKAWLQNQPGPAWPPEVHNSPISHQGTADVSSLASLSPKEALMVLPCPHSLWELRITLVSLWDTALATSFGNN